MYCLHIHLWCALCHCRMYFINHNTVLSRPVHNCCSPTSKGVVYIFVIRLAEFWRTISFLTGWSCPFVPHLSLLFRHKEGFTTALLLNQHGTKYIYQSIFFIIFFCSSYDHFATFIKTGYAFQFDWNFLFASPFYRKEGKRCCCKKKQIFSFSLGSTHRVVSIGTAPVQPAARLTLISYRKGEKDRGWRPSPTLQQPMAVWFEACAAFFHWVGKTNSSHLPPTVKHVYTHTRLDGPRSNQKASEILNGTALSD